MNLNSKGKIPTNEAETVAARTNRKPEPEKRTENFYGIRYTKDELAQIKQAIEASKLMTAEWIRQKLLCS